MEKNIQLGLLYINVLACSFCMQSEKKKWNGIRESKSAIFEKTKKTTLTYCLPTKSCGKSVTILDYTTVYIKTLQIQG